ncbi:MAG: esterase family protein [Anaerolineales bacterium]|nr:esterase family protein [Anaerolineales bacterium]
MNKTSRERLYLEGNPVLDGQRASFVWLGEQAPDLSADFTDWQRGAPVQLEQVSPGTWVYQIQLDPKAYIEYSFMRGDERLLDPFNPRTTPNGVGDTNNYFYLPGGQPTSLARRKTGRLQGEVTRHQVPSDGLTTSRRRTVYLYRPPTPGPYPLVVVWDGLDYLRRARLPVIVDNLIAEGRIQPVALVMIQNSKTARMLEYGASDITLGFLMDNVLPLAQVHLDLLDVASHPGAFGVLGASMGGLMAMYTGCRLPQVFGKVLSQSGAFSIAGRDLVIFDLLRHIPNLPIQIWMDVGLYDFKSLLAANRKLKLALEERGCRFSYREYPAGHNYPAWRDEVWRGLEYLYPAR